jgi:catechol 2,3-dioxygenase-like lactoylglutathione lyase family enzyme
MITGLNHITLIVKDLNKSSELLIYLFGAKEIYNSGDDYHSLSKEKFFLVNNIWIALMQGDDSINKTYNHIAFTIAESQFADYLSKIEKLGLEVLDDRKRIKGEGRSIYFYDYDNHLFELHTGSLNERLKEYNKINL